MLSTNRHRMIAQSFVINKPEQVYHFQIRLPRNTKQVVAIDYDVFVKGISSASGNTTPDLPNTNSIQFTWSNKTNPSIGTLKLQSLETANIFYSQWIKLLEWNIGIHPTGLFPFQPHSLLQKQIPLRVEVSPQTTLLNGLYEDVILKSATTTILSYQVKVFVWLEMNEEAKGVEFEFLKPTAND